jgi:hypothetical protein
MDCRVKPGNDSSTAFAPDVGIAMTVQNVSPHRPAPHRGFEFIAELGEFVGGEI